MRCSQALFALFFTSLGLGVACVNPAGDYKDYVKRTEQYRNSGSDSGSIDSMAPTQSIKATYYLACLPNLSFGDTAKLFRFYVESEFTPNMSGGGGNLTLKLTPMKIRDDAGTIIATGLTLHKEPTGLISVTDTLVAANGGFNANFMTAMVAATSNPISFRPITVENTTVKGIFQSAPDGGPGDFCGGLAGQVTMPIMQDLGTPTDNICLFKPLADEAPLPALMGADFTCPGL